MAHKISMLVLGLLLVFPNFDAAPATSSEELENYGFSKQLVERFKLLAMAVEEFLDLYSVLSEKGPKVFDAVLKDPKVLVIKTEEMDNYLKEFRDYLQVAEKVRKGEEKDETFDLFKEFSKIIGNFHSEKPEELSTAAFAIHNSLKENGLESVNDAIVTHFNGFFQKFTAEIERYFAGLNEEEKKGEKAFKAWFEKLKAEEDTMAKLALFDKMIDDDDGGNGNGNSIDDNE